MNQIHTILVVSQVAIYREGVAASLDARSELRVRAAVSDLDAGLTRANTDAVDLCVADVAGFEQSSINYFFMAMSRIGIPVVVIGLPRSPDEAIACLQAGASGYVTREASLEDLYGVVQKTLEKGACVSDDDVCALVQHLRSIPASNQHQLPGATNPGLTGRERQIACHLADNQTNAEIARQLDISVHTVKHHVRNTLHKLGMQRRGDLVAQRDFVTRLVEHAD